MVKVMVFDLETSINSEKHGPAAKDPVNDFHTIIYGDSPDNVIVEHRDEGFGREPSDRFFQTLHNSDILVGHNLPFDLSYIWEHKHLKQWLLNGGVIWDTQIAQYLMSGQRHSFPSLGELQNIYLGRKIKADRISKLYKKGIGADKILAAKDRCHRLFKLYHQYSTDDGVTTLQVYEKQVLEAKKLGMLDIISMYNQYSLTLICCMNTGLQVDIEKCEKTLRDFKVKEMELLQKMQQLIQGFWSDERLPEFNVNSPTHKSAMLFGGDIKVKVKRENGLYKDGRQKYKLFDEIVNISGFNLDKNYTKESKVKGRYQTGDDIINKIYKNSDNDIAKEYCGIQKEAMTYKKLSSTYLEAFISFSGSNGRLYPNFNTTNTVTSRLSSSNPNLQNVPSKGDWAKHIQGLFVAPAGWKCVQIDFCLAPNTRVLTEDFKWVEIKDVNEGDILVGFDELQNPKTKTRKFKPSKVLKKKTLTKPSIILHTSEGKIQCSEDHMFLASGNPGIGGTLQWVKAKDLTLRHKLSKVCEVWDSPENYETGWMSGFLDGEGYCDASCGIGVGQNDDGDNKIGYDECLRLFDKYMTNTETCIDKSKRCKKIRQAGLRPGWQAIGLFQPKRLLQKLKRNYKETTTRSRNNRKVSIEAIERVGEQEVIAIETTSKTFLAEGLLSHNCQLEIYVLAWLSGDKQMTNDLLTGTCFHCLRLSWCKSLSEGKSYEEIYQLAKVQGDSKWVKKRSQAKTISYMKAYGGGAHSLAEATGLEVDDIKELLNKEDSVYYKVKGYNDHVYKTVENMEENSHKKYLPTRMQRGGVNGKRFDKEGFELLPIKSGDINTYEKTLRRKVGYYQSPTKKRYSFEQFGGFDRRGNLRVNYSPTQTKNYQIQGTASDVQAATSAALLQILLKHKDKIEMVNEIHDSKWFYIKEEYLNKIIPQICNIMESVPYLFSKYLGVDVPFKFPVDAEVGDNFAELKPFKKGE